MSLKEIIFKMNNISLRIIIVCLIITSCMSCSNTSNNLKNIENYAYDSLLQKGIDQGFPGIILAIQKGNENPWIGATGYANIEKQKLMLKNDRFHLASVTKIFTSVAILKLIDDGKLKIDDKAITFLDSSLVNPIPFINEITIGQLLDHSSGIYSFNNDMEYIETLIGEKAFDNVNWSTNQLLALAYGNRVEPQGKPGSGHYYADTNLILQSLIIENISGMSFREFINERILKPLKLENTGFYSDRINNSRVELTSTVQGYLKRSKDLDEFITMHPSFIEVSPGIINTSIAGEKIDAGAGMVSTANDLLLFGEALYNGNLLSPESLNWLLSIGDGIENEGLNSRRQGIVSVRNKPYGVLFTSLGDGPGGMNTMLAYHPKTKSIVIAFTNIFGNFDEHDFFMDDLMPLILKEQIAPTNVN